MLNRKSTENAHSNTCVVLRTWPCCLRHCPRDLVLTFGYSKTVECFLVAAHASDIPFEAVVAECAPRPALARHPSLSAPPYLPSLLRPLVVFTKALSVLPKQKRDWSERTHVREICLLV